MIEPTSQSQRTLRTNGRVAPLPPFFLRRSRVSAFAVAFAAALAKGFAGIARAPAKAGDAGRASSRVTGATPAAAGLGGSGFIELSARRG